MKNKYKNYLKLIGKNRLLIYQYLELVDIDKEKILIDNLVIYGSNLKILIMDDDKIEIVGTIKTIKVE